MYSPFVLMMSTRSSCRRQARWSGTTARRPHAVEIAHSSSAREGAVNGRGCLPFPERALGEPHVKVRQRDPSSVLYGLEHELAAASRELEHGCLGSIDRKWVPFRFHEVAATSMMNAARRCRRNFC